MKTPISYYGGKQTLLKHILPLIPKHKLYTEAFCGGAAVLFAKRPADGEVIIEKEDFVSLRQNPQPDSQWINPNPKIDYFISVSCLEYIFTLLFRGDLVCQQLSCDTARSVPLFYHI